MALIDTIKVGDFESIEKTFYDEDVILFSKLSLDTNPIHLSDDFAKNSFFKKRIVHGMLYSSLISAILGTKLPGPGSIYMKQELKFLRPVFIGDKIKAVCKIVSINVEKSIIELSTQCFKNDEEIVLDGLAIIKIL